MLAGRCRFTSEFTYATFAQLRAEQALSFARLLHPRLVPAQGALEQALAELPSELLERTLLARAQFAGSSRDEALHLRFTDETAARPRAAAQRRCCVM